MIYKTGGFWADENTPREHCYKVVPLSIAQDVRKMTLHAFDVVYQALGKLGYRFRDTGHNSEYVTVSLDRPISQKHLEQLEEVFSIQQDSGAELGFC